MQEERLREYCKSRLLDFTLEDGVLLIQDKYYELVEEDALLFDEDLSFLPVGDEEADGFVYYFGGRWYLQESEDKVDLLELKNIGKAVQKLPTKTFLGIHSGYELMNGVGLYEDWVDKASFLGVEALGICELSTLSGVLVFQAACKKKGIKPVVGMTVPIQGKDRFTIKLYAKDFQGWLQLLKYNTILNVEEEISVGIEFLNSNLQDLFIVADPKTTEFSELKSIDRVDFYQLDPVFYLNTEQDEWYINNLEKFILSEIEPISISDAYCIEEADIPTREALWLVNKAFDFRTSNQYLKNRDQYAADLIKFFDKEEKYWIKLYKRATANEEFLAESCNFEYDMNTRHLPRYKMTEEEEKQFKSNDELFLHLIKIGFKKKGFKDPKRYVDRLKIEIEVLKMGDVIDYFLTLYDIMRFAESKELLTGIARGSAGGSLVAYLLDIIKIDPIELDLLFERFLNSGRMGEYQDRPSFKVTLEDGSTVDLQEGSLVRVNRDGEEKVLYIEDLRENDELIKY